MPLSDQDHAQDGQPQSKRLRVPRACDRCKKRKIRCTGTQRCESCTRDGASCMYTAPYNRGRRAHVDSTGFTLASEDVGFHGGTEVEVTANDRSGRQQQPSQTSPVSELMVSRPASTGLKTDPQNHYVGPAAGVFFLARVRARLHHDDQPSTHFVFDDVPLPERDAIPSDMISNDEATRLVDKFFNFTTPIDRLLERSTIDLWVQEFIETMGTMKRPEGAPCQRAMLWIIFALAHQHMSVGADGDEYDKAVQYFLAAEYHLSRDKGRVGLIGIQTRLYQCLWLLSRSRVNHCWDLFGSTARMALTLGLHREWSSSTNSGTLSEAEQQSCRATFWSLYCLDTHLSLTLGRPRMLHDEDIDQELPSDSDVSDSPNSLDCSVMVAPVAHYKLHRIVTSVLRDLYPIRPVSTTEQCDLSHRYVQRLKEWRKTIPDFLQIETDGDPPLAPIYKRQRQVLKVTYWHALIITTRPLLLKNFTLSQVVHNDTELGAIKECIRECLSAALAIARQINLMQESGRLFRSFYGTFYHGFFATAVLYVYTIQIASSAQTYQEYFQAATRSHGVLSKFTDNDCLISRYCVMLEDLRREALKQIDSEPSTRSIHSGNSDTIAHLNTAAAEFADGVRPSAAYPTAFDTNYVPAPGDMTALLGFESSVSEALHSSG